MGFGLGMLVAVGGCFASSPSVDEDNETGGAPSSEDGSSTDTSASTSAVDESSGSAVDTGTTTGSDPTSSTSRGSTTDGSGDSTSTTETPSESTGGLPDWVADCNAQGLTLEPTVPAASEPWVVQFEDPLPLANVVLEISDGSGADEYGVTRMCGMKPFCWTFDVAANAWPAGPVSLSITADGFPGASCDIELL